MESDQEAAECLAERCRLSDLALQFRDVFGELLTVFYVVVELVHRLAERRVARLSPGYSFFFAPQEDDGTVIPAAAVIG